MWIYDALAFSYFNISRILLLPIILNFRDQREKNPFEVFHNRQSVVQNEILHIEW